ncbi:MAG: adenosine deaminase [Alphaproteobacteria bacterium]|nr:MAG: adenosine deaminase [Alphaproteobacteria bacterium]
MVKKAELHVHLEGTATPELVRELSGRNGATIDPATFGPDGDFAWGTFLEFLTAYDRAAAVILTKDDYRRVTYDYLRRCAEEEAIYVEMFSSPDHAAAVGMSYTDHLDGIAAGIEEAKADFGIEGRIIVTCVRHLGPERAEAVARQVVAHPHPLVVGFGMGGDEGAFEAADFAPAFTHVHQSGLAITSHAGEFGGPTSIRDTLLHLPVQRLGHGVRVIEDESLLQEIASRKIPLELCPGSNVATGLFDNRSAHPFKNLMEQGCVVTLNSDDPPFFKTSIGREYDAAAQHYGLDEAALTQITRNAIAAAFCDDALKEELSSRL